MVLKKIFNHLPRHAYEIRDLRHSRCTGFCRFFDFTGEASDRVINIILRM